MGATLCTSKHNHPSIECRHVKSNHPNKNAGKAKYNHHPIMVDGISSNTINAVPSFANNLTLNATTATTTSAEYDDEVEIATNLALNPSNSNVDLSQASGFIKCSSYKVSTTNILDENSFLDGIGGNKSASNSMLISPSSYRRQNSEDLSSDEKLIGSLCVDTYVRQCPFEPNIGDEIELISQFNRLRGRIDFVGQMQDKNGIFYGLRMNKEYGSDAMYFWKKVINESNGFKEVDYKKAKFGDECIELFVKGEQIERILFVNYSIPRICVNDKVYLSQFECNGIVKCIAKGRKEWIYGIELSEYNEHASNGMFCGKQFIKDCKNGYGVFMNSDELMRDNFNFLIYSKLNLFVNGYSENDQNISSDIIAIINLYYNVIKIRLTEHQMNEQNGVSVVQKYEAFDFNDNVIGPTIIAKYNGLKTHFKKFETVISGNYLFSRSTMIDSGDFNVRWFTKTTFEITKYDNGDSLRILRLMKGDNEAPIMKDYKSIRTRLRHDIHYDDVDECDHQMVWKSVAELYGLTKEEMRRQFDEYRITLYGLSPN